MMDIFQEVKSFNNKIIRVAGGVHVSNATEIVLKEGKNIDFKIFLRRGQFCRFCKLYKQ